jgi:choline dehydrogenase-like flavoprotein
VRVDGQGIILEWRPSNLGPHEKLVTVTRERMRAAGYPVILTKRVDGRLPSHQCGTARLGDNPANSAVDPFGRSWDHRNLFIADASILPTSAAVNPSLTVAALALRAADHIRRAELRIGGMAP